MTTVKELITVLGSCDPDAEIKSIRFFKDSDKMDAMDISFKSPMKRTKRKIKPK